MFRRFRADGVPLDPTDRRVNTFTTGDQLSPDVAVDPNGNFVVVWSSSDGLAPERAIRMRRFRADGTALDPTDLRIDSAPGSTRAYPAVASDARGNFVVVWESVGSHGDDDDAHSIQRRAFLADGTPLDAQELQVNVVTTSNQRGPDIAMAPDGRYIVAWYSGQADPGDPSGQSVQARLFDGALDPPQFQVNVATYGDQTLPDVAMGEDGAFAVAFQSFVVSDTPLDSDVFVRRYDAAGTALDAGELLVNTYTPGPQEGPAIEADPEGNLFVAWTSQGGSPGTDSSASAVVGRRLRRDGDPIDAADFQLNSLTSGYQAGPSVAVEIDGDLVATWSSATSAGSDPVESVQRRRFGRPTIAVDTLSGGSGVAGCSLREAITAAQTDAPFEGCPAGNEGAIVALPADASIVFADAAVAGFALPTISRTVTIAGNRSTLVRDGALECPAAKAADDFAFVEVAGGGVLTIEGLTLRGGCAPAATGGAIRSGGTLNLRRARIEQNEAFDGGGIFSFDARLHAVDSTFDANRASNLGGGLGADHFDDWSHLRRSTVTGNTATFAGAGVYLEGRGVLEQVTISANSGTGSAVGGGLAVMGGGLLGGSVTLDFSTVVENGASSGPALYLATGAALGVHGSLVGTSTAAHADCAVDGDGFLFATGANLELDGSCGTLAGGGFSTVAAFDLGPLGANGGPTDTHVPLSTSPARDAAPACATQAGAPLAWDQRSYPRPTDDDADTLPECDLGAVESGLVFLCGFERGALAEGCGFVFVGGIDP
jgi:CSLREA domain-containing protein